MFTKLKKTPGPNKEAVELLMTMIMMIQFGGIEEVF
jgi:hypothetical protein